MWLTFAAFGCRADDDSKPPSDSDERESAAPSDTSSEDSRGTADSALETGDDTGPRDRETTTHSLSPDLGAKLVGIGDEDLSSLVASAAGDVNSDGFADIVVGNPFGGVGVTGRGRAFLVHGPISGTIGLADSDARFEGTDEDGQAGDAVSSAGDVDADGYDDLLIAAPQFNETGTYEGQVYLVRGAVEGTVLLSDADAVLQGDAAPDADCETWSMTGASVAPAGDTDDDGAADFLVGAPGNNCGMGAVYLVKGPISGTVLLSGVASTTIAGDRTSYCSYLGAWGTPAADANGDGLNDILVPTLGHDYRLLIYLSPAPGVFACDDADAWITADPDATLFGNGSVAGDTNGDGYPDFLVGFPLLDAYGGDGAVTLFNGPFSGERDVATPDAVITGDNPEATLSQGQTAGDINADGRADIVLSHSGYYSEAVHILLGPMSGTISLDDADVDLLSEDEADMPGGAVTAGDVDADGLDDILLVGDGDDEAGPDAGAAWLVYAANLW